MKNEIASSPTLRAGEESIGLYVGVGDGRVMPLLRSFIVFSFFDLSTYRAYGAGSVLIYGGFYLECDLS